MIDDLRGYSDACYRGEEGEMKDTWIEKIEGTALGVLRYPRAHARHDEYDYRLHVLLH
jgi:hypothetical protein